MRYGIKYGGTIYVGQPGALVRRLEREVGEYRERGEPVPGGWARLVEPVNEAVLDTLRGCYEVCEV